MAQYEIIGLLPGSRLEAGTRIIDTISATFVTQPHEVNGEVTVDKVEGWRDALIAAVAKEAAELESVFGG